MKPILYEYNEVHFLTNGLGRLSDAISCNVEEARNGIYELTMVYPTSGLHFADLKEGRMIYARHDETIDRQPFKIYAISRPIDGKVTVRAHHLTYDLSKITVMPCSATSASSAMSAIEHNTAAACDFVFWTDVNTDARWHVDVPSSVRSVLGGTKGSILDCYGGEYEWDHRTVKLRSARGRQTDAVISYGKNLTKIKYDTDDSSVWTGIIPYWRGNSGGNTEEVVTLTEKIVYSPYRSNFDEDRYIPVDFSSDFENKPEEADLRTKAQAYVSANARSGIPASIDVSFVELWQTEEYKAFAPLERLRLCDTVTIRHKEFGVEAKAKIVKTRYDVLNEKYLSMTVGEIRTDLASSIQQSISDVMDTVSANMPTKVYMQRAINHATDLLRGGLGGHVIISTNANGEPNEIYIMDQPDAADAVNVLRINVNGIGFSSHGVDGPFASAWTLDGRFVADFITAGTMSANLIHGGTLTLGGADNGNGTMVVYDANDNVIGRWNNSGIYLVYETISGSVGAAREYVRRSDWTYLMNSSVYGFVVAGQQRRSTGHMNRSNGQAVIAPDTIQVHSDTDLRALKLLQNSETDRSIVTHDNNHTKVSMFNEFASTEDYIAEFSTYDITGTTSSSENIDDTGHMYVYLGKNSFGIGTSLHEGASSSIGQDYALNDSGDYFHPGGSNWPFLSVTNKEAYIGNGGHSEQGYSVADTFLHLYYGGRIVAEDALLVVRSGAYVSFFSGCEFHGTSGYIRANGQYLQYLSSSSRRYKNSIEPIHDSKLDPHRLYSLPVRQFRYNEDALLQYKDMDGMILPGFIAEEVAEIYPAAVIHDQEDHGRIESWDERRIIPGMLALIQEQNERINKLERQMEILCKRE